MPAPVGIPQDVNSNTAITHTVFWDARPVRVYATFLFANVGDMGKPTSGASNSDYELIHACAESGKMLICMFDLCGIDATRALLSAPSAHRENSPRELWDQYSHVLF